MADIDIDPFGEHDKTEDPTDENIPLDPVTQWEEDQLGNQHMNRKHRLEEESLKEPN